jgi:hypothetical protein
VLGAAPRSAHGARFLRRINVQNQALPRKGSFTVVSQVSGGEREHRAGSVAVGSCGDSSRAEEAEQSDGAVRARPSLVPLMVVAP